MPVLFDARNQPDMSTISIRRPIHSRTEARNALEHAAEAIAERYDIEYQWEGDEIHFYRAGVDGTMRVDDDHVSIDARLGFLLAMMKGPIEQEIARQLDHYLDA